MKKILKKILMTVELMACSPKIFKETCRIDWTKSCAEINNLVRGLSPYPAAWTQLHRDDTELTVKIFAVTPEVASHNQQPGTIVSDNKHTLKIACADGWISVNELQLAGKRRMHTDELLRGFKEIDSYCCR